MKRSEIQESPTKKEIPACAGMTLDFVKGPTPPLKRGE